MASVLKAVQQPGTFQLTHPAAAEMVGIFYEFDFRIGELLLMTSGD